MTMFTTYSYVINIWTKWRGEGVKNHVNVVYEWPFRGPSIFWLHHETQLLFVQKGLMSLTPSIYFFLSLCSFLSCKVIAAKLFSDTIHISPRHRGQVNNYPHYDTIKRLRHKWSLHSFPKKNSLPLPWQCINGCFFPSLKIDGIII